MAAKDKITKEPVEKQLKRLPGWKLEQNAISKEFTFKNFKNAFRFMSLCAEIAEEMQHHPEWSNNYNKVTVRLTTHSAGGVTESDFELARRMDEIVEKM